jgi:hypothetical protein
LIAAANMHTIGELILGGRSDNEKNSECSRVTT